MALEVYLATRNTGDVPEDLCPWWHLAPGVHTCIGLGNFASCWSGKPCG